jgi:hypothetical protein
VTVILDTVHPTEYFEHSVPGTDSVRVFSCKGGNGSYSAWPDTNSCVHCVQWSNWVIIFSSLYLITERDAFPKMLLGKCQAGGQWAQKNVHVYFWSKNVKSVSKIFWLRRVLVSSGMRYLEMGCKFTDISQESTAFSLRVKEYVKQATRKK